MSNTTASSITIDERDLDHALYSLGADTYTRSDGEVTGTFYQCEVTAMVADERDDAGRTLITYTVLVGGEEVASNAFTVVDGEDLGAVLEAVLTTHAPAVREANA